YPGLERGRNAGEEGVLIDHRDGRLAELALIPGRDPPAEARGDQLEAVADSKRGDAELEELHRNIGASGAADGVGSARQDHAGWPLRHHALAATAIASDLAIDRKLADAPRDQLRILASEVEDEDLLAVNGLLPSCQRIGAATAKNIVGIFGFQTDSPARLS